MSTATTQRSRSLGFRGIAVRTPYWVFTTALAVLFLYPLVWTGVSSVSPHPGTNQVNGWGFGNYLTLGNYQAGVWVYILNTVIGRLLSRRWASTPSRGSVSSGATRCSCSRLLS